MTLPNERFPNASTIAWAVEAELRAAMKPEWRLLAGEEPMHWTVQLSDPTDAIEHDYAVHVTPDLEHVVVTHGNDDAGVLTAKYFVRRASMFPLELLNSEPNAAGWCVRVRDAFAFIFEREKPNGWGYS